MADEAPASPLQTRLFLLDRARRGFVPIRHNFVQKPRNDRKPRAPRGSMLGRLVSDHQERALDAFLYLLGVTPGLDDNDALAASVWARALSDTPSSAAAMSRIWLQLERRNLVERSRHGGHTRIVPRREDGRARYTRPGAAEASKGGWPRNDWYFVLPHEYWNQGWDQRLTLPAKAMLLISLQATSNSTTYYLPYDRAPQWYGVSADTAQRGLRALRNEGLLREHFQKITAPLSPTGSTTRTHYTLLGAFSTDARHQLQKATKKAVRAKAARRARTGK